MQINAATVVAGFTERDMAERAIAELRAGSISDDAIKFLTPETRDSSTASEPAGQTAGDVPIGGPGASIGTVAGAALGGLATGTLPGMVLVGLAGGMMGALTDVGVTEADMRFAENEVRNGHYVVVVQAGSQANQVALALQNCGAYEVRPPANEFSTALP